MIQEMKGTKEYLPEEQIVREKIKSVIVKNFQKYGYKPIETTILELYEVAANKYAGGEEILKETYTFSDQGNRKLCLRYELTFKLAKLIGLNPNIRLPFKRYEIGKVFRDGPVKTGRLREFTQCDVDVVGIESVVVDAEFMNMIFDVFNELKLDVYVQANNRKLLFGIFEFCNIEKENFVEFALSLDKLEKYGEKEVKKELIEKRFDAQSINKVFGLLNEIRNKKTNNEKILFLEKTLTNELGKQGVIEVKDFFNYCEYFAVKGKIELVPTLARGLGYYTGMMWEVYLTKGKITSSVSAGGRWDNMISKFLETEQKYPSTGMTFGLDVIYEAIKEIDENENSKTLSTTKVYLIPINTLNETLAVASELRQNGIAVDVAFDKKLSKALDYANKESIEYIIVVGNKELECKKFKLKNMITGEEKELNLKDVVNELKN